MEPKNNVILKIFKFSRIGLLSALALMKSATALAGVSSVAATSDATNAYYSYQFTDQPKFLRVYLDLDRNSSTGYPVNGIGADALIENTYLYNYAGSQGSWAWTKLKTISMVRSTNSVKWTVARADLKTSGSLALAAQMKLPLSTSSPITQTLFVANPVVSLNVAGAPNLPLNGTSTKVTVGFVSGTPLKVELSRDGYPPFAVWPTDSSFVLSSDGKSLSKDWCITSSCWRGEEGDHVLNVVATYSGGSTAKASVQLKVADVVETQPIPVPQPEPIVTGPVFYVSVAGNDANPGSQSAPWRTIQKAANTVNPGDTVILMDGSYETTTVSFRRSGTADKRITFKAQNKWKAIVSSTSGCQPGFSINASYITVKDLRFTLSPKNVACSTFSSANTSIRAWEKTAPTPSNPSTGYVGFVADGLYVDSGIARDVGIKSNQDFTIIQNSQVGNDVNLLNNKGSIIRNNLIFGQNRHGISIVAKGGVRDAQIYNNVVRNKAVNGYGIDLGGYSCDACHYDTGTNIEAYNSVAYNNVLINESGGDFLALIFQGAKDSAFFNNVVIGGRISMMLGGHNSGPQASNANPVLMNNIFMCNGGAAMGSKSYTGTLKLDYNNFYNCTGAPSQAHPIVGNPLFVNPASDFRLQAGSPAINMGAPTQFIGFDGSRIDVSRDKNGVVRTAPYDLGIYNYDTQSSTEVPTPTPTPTPVVSGPTYFVSPTGSDTNSGTQNSPWRTIQKAANSVVAGDTVVLMDGVYETPSVSFRRSGTADKRITFKSQNKWKAIVSSTSGCNPGLSIQASYVTIKDVRLSVSSKNVTCPQFSSANAGIRAWNSIDATPSNPNSGYVGFIADGIYMDPGLQRGEGIKSNQDFSIIQNCELGNTINILNTKKSIIRNNLIFGQNEYGISILAKGGVRDAQIYNNFVRNKAPNGLAIAIGGYSCDACHFDTSTNMEAYNSVAYNNIVINESSGDVAGLILEGAKDSGFFNNIVIGGQLTMMLGGHNTGPQASNESPAFMNNIVVCNGRPLISNRGWNYSGSLRLDYNNFYNCTGVPSQAHPIVGNPLFVNPASDFRLQAGSPAINAGIPIQFIGFDGMLIDVSRDKNGVVRTAPYDLGIYNYDTGSVASGM